MPQIYRKLLMTLAVTLVLLLPQAAITDLVDERAARRGDAVTELNRDFPAAGEVRGPVLQIPTRSLTADGKWEVRGSILVHPRELTIDGDVDASFRRRGIYRVPTFVTKLQLDAVFPVPETGERGETLDFDWAHARLHVVLTSDDQLVLPGLASVGTDAREMTFGKTFLDRSFATVSSLLPGQGHQGGKDLPVRILLTLRGSEGLRVTPLADQVAATLRSNWPDPSFASGWLPDGHEITSKGFRATFKASMLAPDVQLALGSERQDVWTDRARSFGVELKDTTSDYVQVSRAVKYAVLFVMLTFLTFLLFEVLAGLKLHPVQYLTVGAALVLFFLLLLSFSEQLAFGWAYLIATVAVVSAVTGYTRAILAGTRRALGVGAGLFSLYGMMFVLLQLESYALISGSVALFLILAAFMYLTRRVDWYGLGKAQAGPLLSERMAEGR